jgi:hypothetical protein
MILGGRGAAARPGRAAARPYQASRGEFQIRLAGDDVVGKLDDGLVFGFVADLRSAEDDFDFGPDAHLMAAMTSVVSATFQM